MYKRIETFLQRYPLQKKAEQYRHAQHIGDHTYRQPVTEEHPGNLVDKKGIDQRNVETGFRTQETGNDHRQSQNSTEYPDPQPHVPRHQESHGNGKTREQYTPRPMIQLLLQEDPFHGAGRPERTLAFLMCNFFIHHYADQKNNTLQNRAIMSPAMITVTNFS